MVNVNRERLNQKDANRLLCQFDSTLSKLSYTSVTVLLNELLGKEERITFAKRLAAIVLLVEGCSEYRTSRLLKLSPTTTGKIAESINAGTYNGIISLLRKKKRDYFAFLDTLDSILHLGGLLPHRVGLDRYKLLR